MITFTIARKRENHIPTKPNHCLNYDGGEITSNMIKENIAVQSSI